MIANANEILFRASSVGKIMGKIGLTENKQNELTVLSSKEKITDKQKEKLDFLINKRNNPDMPSGIKTHLIDLFMTSMYSRREEVDSKYLRKGNECEEDSITLLSRVTKSLFNKNKVRKSDEFFTGEWDMNDLKLNHTLDTKTSWNLRTFLQSSFNELEENYFYQGQVYMHLTGAKKHTVAYCLVNSTAEAIDQEKRYLSLKSGMIDPKTGNESDIFVSRAKQIEINMIYDLPLFKSRYPYYPFHNDESTWNYDIPKEKRVKLFSFERDEAVIKLMIERVKLCREWINTNLINHETNL